MKWLSILVLVFPLVATELHHAVHALDLKRTEALLKQGAAIDAQDARGESVMHIAARYGRLSMLRLLLGYHPDLYLKNAAGLTPLGVAIARNHIQSIQLILAAQQKQESPLDMPPLHRAVAENAINDLLSLLREGFDVDAPNARGMTPLHLAARGGNVQMTLLLLQFGADPRRHDDEGRDALYYARYGNNPAVTELIETKRRETGD